MDSIISIALKSDANEHAVRSRLTRKDFERFRNRSVRKPYERSLYERTFVSEPIDGESCFNIPNELSNLQKRHHIFRRDREPSRIPVRTLHVGATRAERLENLFTNVSVEYTQVFKNALFY